MDNYLIKRLIVKQIAKGNASVLRPAELTIPNVAMRTRFSSSRSLWEFPRRWHQHPSDKNCIGFTTIQCMRCVGPTLLGFPDLTRTCLSMLRNRIWFSSIIWFSNNYQDPSRLGWFRTSKFVRVCSRLFFGDFEAVKLWYPGT